MKRKDSRTGVQEEQPHEILDKVVKDASLYTAMKTPGSIQPSHFFPPFSGELVLLTLPDVVNPIDLINSEVVIGGRKDSLVVAQGQKYRMATYPTDPDNTSHPSLFLPDQDGQLTKVTAEIKACLVVKGEVEEKEEEGKNFVDIETLRSIHYKTPKELQRRDFFSKTGTREVTVKVEKPVKRKKKSVSNTCSLNNSLQSNGEVQSPGKKKKSKHMSSDSTEASENSLHAEELGNHMKKKIKKEYSESESGNLNPVSLKEKKKSKEKISLRT